jgi:mono/diheme cytochrome c family protein
LPAHWYNRTVKSTAMLSILLLSWPAFQAPAAEPERVDFARDVRPILERACWKCHGPEKQKGGVRLDRRIAALSPGDSGAKPITPGKADESELVRRIEAKDAEERMPPKSDPLSREETRILRAWIDHGARWPETAAAAASFRKEMVVTAEDRQHWSYQPLLCGNLPAVHDRNWCRTPIDQFVLEALEARGIHPNPPADRRTLIRRLYFDLLGLPPSPQEVKEFVADPATDAYEKLVDRLLASRHYGERWGRHWLDVARFADSDGMESDADRRTAYHYRDFVIEAMNDDMPYQKFVRWQLAGDEFEPDNPRALAATGFLAAAPTEVLDVPMEEEKLRLRFDELDDMAVTTSSAFLGLTLGCARCHDHKYDAIPTRDYYRLQCAFTTTKRDEGLLATRGDAARYREQESRWRQRVKAAEDKLNAWLDQRKPSLQARLRNEKIDALSIGAKEKALLKEQPESKAGKKLAKQHEKALTISDDDLRRAFADPQRREWDALKKELEASKRSKPRKPATALVIIDTQAKPEPTWLLERGDFYAKKELLQVGFLTVLTGSRSPEDYWNAARREVGSDKSTGQRRALADWITDVDQGAGALLSRVLVNRVWQHHLGEGLVRTVGDFGVRGERPTHPALLEWLAHAFVDGGWRLKPLHRLILTSAVYMQDTTFDPDRATKDAEDRLLWRRRPQRLEAESLRDAVLSVSGTLNPRPFGPAFKPPIPPEAMLARNTKDPYPKDASDTPATRRRTVYMFHKRVVQHPLMQAFDGPEAAVSCGRRSVTTVAPQALALLNDTFLRDRATDLARRLVAESDATPDGRVTRGFELALARPPREAERTAAVQFLATQTRRRLARDKSLSPDQHQLQALADFAQVLFSLNEFIYVD